MKKAVITGAGGFIGRSLTQKLLAEGVQILGIDLASAQDRIVDDPSVIKSATDLSNKEQVAALLLEFKPDVVYHLAWNGVSTDVKNDVMRQASNMPIALTILEACAEAACKHIVIPGSASEYAYCGESIDGNNKSAPGDAYAAAKAATQIMCQWYAKQLGLNLNWLLIGSIYGPGRNDSNILTYTIKALLRGEETAYSKLEQMWDYIYIDDLIEALFLVGLYGKPDTVYPVGSGEARPLAEYIEQLRDVLAPNVELGIGKLPYKLGSKPDNSVLDITRLQSDTGFKPSMPFSQGIKRMIDYFVELENSGRCIE